MPVVQNGSMDVVEQERSYDTLTLKHLAAFGGLRLEGACRDEQPTHRSKGATGCGVSRSGGSFTFRRGGHGVKDFDIWLFYRSEELHRHVQTQIRE